MVNRDHKLSQRHGALQSQHGTKPALGTISKTLGTAELHGCCNCCHHKMTIQLHSSTEARLYQPSANKRSLVGVSGHAGAWHRPAAARTRLLAISGTLPNAELEQGTVALLFLADKRAKSSYLHSLVKTPTKLTREMILKVLFGAGLKMWINITFPLAAATLHWRGWSTSYQDGSKGRSIFNQLHLSLAWVSQSLQRTSHSCSHKANELP